MEIVIHCQPTDTTCGPTSLHAVYQYYKDNISLTDVIAEVDIVDNGGTLAPLLGLHALKRGYYCEIHPYNIYIFDPTWFYPKKLPTNKLIEKLEQQHDEFESPTLRENSKAHIDFLKHGGEVSMHDLNPALLKKYFDKRIPLLTGVSATYLYRCAREIDDENGVIQYNDIKGLPAGHFVVLHGYEKSTKDIIVADPLKTNPLFEDSYYRVHASRLINAIMLGVLTNDANILIVKPKV